MKRFYSATALGLILSATPVVAEITPESVWEQMGRYFEANGFTVENAALDESGDTLTVRDFRVRQQVPDSDLQISFGDMVLTDNGDGTVSLNMSDEAAGTILMQVPVPPEEDAVQAADGAAEAADEDVAAAPTEDAAEAPADPATEAVAEMETRPVEVAFTLKVPGDSTTISEDGAAYVYDYAFPSLEVSLDRLQVEDEEPKEDLGRLTVTEIKGTDRIQEDGPLTLHQDVTAATMAIDFAFEDEDVSFTTSMKAAGIDVISDLIVPEGSNMGADIVAALGSGLDISGKTEIGEFQADFDVVNKTGESEGAGGKASWDSQDLAVDFGLSGDELRYAGSAGVFSVDANLASSNMPIAYSADSAKFDVAIPVAAKPDPQDFHANYGFQGLELSESLWSMFDPQAALPRDPASLDVDIDGQAILNMNLLDPEAMEASTTPGQVKLLNINNIALSMLGADAKITGRLEGTEGSNLASPVGTVSGRFEGVNGLLDKLASAGLIPEEQMMGARMMLMMFAQPDAENPEVLTTELEFREGGAVFANGQQVK
ncbi:DUF2125 domain-containing protein [Paracoccus aerodenitrificans]|uniref:DUF2125 domain-containing protein n=1 Tax=Paracoccus aerodenitrificans TaxID=3017781 RepID=UPI0022F0F062|nr:DUF2125 domain-containing protein [Paracoccus aerodenitrificans]WBU63865.1 DUF2125 domain-containing protein [Paracoccus aerodenitrificans]